MVLENIMLLYALLVLIFIVLCYSIKRIAKVRVWIKTSPKAGTPLIQIGYLQMDDSGAAGEVKLSASGGKAPIARVVVDGESNKNNGYVELITTDIEDETVKPNYRQVGYIGFDSAVVDEFGIIYKHVKGKRKEQIGYTARPSAPNTPTIYGERSWKTLKLVCTLNAYYGKPDPSIDEKANEDKKKKKDKKGGKNSKNDNVSSSDQKEKSVEVNRIMYIADSKDEPANTDAFEVVDELNNSSLEEAAIKVPANQDAVAVDLPNEASTEATSLTEEQPNADIPEDADTVSGEHEEEEKSMVEEPEESPTLEDDTLSEDSPSSEDTSTQENANSQDDAESQEDASSQGNADTQEDANSQDDTDSQGNTANTEPVKVPEIKEKNKVKIPTAVCHFVGLHDSTKDYLPAEARAAAYALLSQKFPRRNYSEYYKDKPYGWLDTALLTTFVFSVVYVILYIVNTAIMRMPLLGSDFWAVSILIAFYYILWILVRFIKIDCIENSNSFQPKLDLFNKNLGLNFVNWSIIFMGLVAMYFTFVYYDYDFIPLIWAIVSGVGFNMMLKSANTKWKISTTFNEKDEFDDDLETEVKNPEGDIAKTYEWVIDKKYSSLNIRGTLTLYFYANEIKDITHSNPFFAQRKDRRDEDYILDMFHFLKDHKSFLARTRYIVSVIDKIVEKHGLTPIDRLQFALDFVQEPNIQFIENKNDQNINFYDDYIRYPDETLYYKCGDSNSKSLLAAMIFHVMGFNVLYMISRKHQHAAIGIQINNSDLQNGWYGNAEKLKNSIIEDNGKKFLICETTGDNFALGSTLEDIDIDDFDRKILLPLVDDNDENEDVVHDDTIVTRIYNWDLDSELGNTLHGSLTLDFSEKEITGLRELNPFQSYGQNSNTYEMNIRSIFSYLFGNEARYERVKIVADYIRKSVMEANLSTLDLVQFTLDFAQAPNITYCVDENSKGIDCAKEYMRFPDEVLFDKEGDCDCKSSLTCALYHSLGYNVIIMLSVKLGHAAIGIELEDEWLATINPADVNTVVREYNGKRYVYCETTGDGYRVGHIKEGDSIQDFETIIEIPV